MKNAIVPTTRVIVIGLMSSVTVLKQLTVFAATFTFGDVKLLPKALAGYEFFLKS